MKTSEFNYYLPKELIAQDPMEQRDHSRLLVIDKKTGQRQHKIFHDIIDYLNPGDCLVINNTKVIPARLIGEREGTGGKIELLLLKRIGINIWETLVKPGKKAKVGVTFLFGDGLLKAKIKDIIEDGKRIVQFEYDGIFEEILDKLGQMPLPPYITHKLEDKNRYQTVYAKYEGSAAAPTAGLHFTEELLKNIEDKGINIAKVTLHVGLGTFRPVQTEDIANHHMHTEEYHVDSKAADLINKTKKKDGRVVCVGTTSLRTVESAAVSDDIIHSGDGNTGIFIYPGYRFKIADALITNFHLPESTLLMLVSAFIGKNEIMEAYEEAISQKYRFFSFGDAMFMNIRRLVYNDDGSYNQKYYTEYGKLKLPYSKYLQEEEDYNKQIKSIGIENAWNLYHKSK